MEATKPPSSPRYFAMLLLVSCVAGQHADCGGPGNITELMARLNSLNPGTFVQYDPQGHLDGVTRSVNTTTTIHSYPDCPTSVGDPSAAVNDRALCPWQNREVHYLGQYPPSLVEARCLCQRCVENRGFSCEPVTSATWVLQQTGECRSGARMYRAIQRNITVGCTCVNPVTNGRT
ncbi:interleukin 17-like protein [Haliotis rufescens]|uniref:interleukin 17-like protein n=1 Tax=Haliotis rufescens TaxID=6454 RepID=UPI00201E9037|nr:interleukin 17-like protein [Haliotis rufescens]